MLNNQMVNLDVVAGIPTSQMTGEFAPRHATPSPGTLCCIGPGIGFKREELVISWYHGHANVPWYPGTVLYILSHDSNMAVFSEKPIPGRMKSLDSSKEEGSNFMSHTFFSSLVIWVRLMESQALPMGNT